MGACRYGSMKVWEHGGMGAWRYGSMEAHCMGSMGYRSMNVHYMGSMEVWEHGGTIREHGDLYPCVGHVEMEVWEYVEVWDHRSLEVCWTDGRV